MTWTGWDNDDVLGDLLTADQATHVLGIPTGTIRSWVSRGKLTVEQKDKTGRKLFWERDLLRLRDGKSP